MQKSRDKNSYYYRKHTPSMKIQETQYLTDSLKTTPSKPKISTIESSHTKAAYLKESKSPSSSMFGEDYMASPQDYNGFQESILKKVECIQQQTNQLLEKKERELYFMKIQLKNNESRLQDAQQALIRKDQQIQKLTIELQNRNSSVSTFSKYNFVMEENQKLKESLNMLINEKNQNWLYHQHKQEYGANQVVQLKKQVQELKLMVSQMQKLVYNCPSCFALKRQVEEMTEAYSALQVQFSKLKQQNENKEKSLLQNITEKIQENQNILRQNHHLKIEKEPRFYYLKHKREKLNDSVAKRCRTLTDNF